MTMKYLLHKDRKEIGKTTAQKQECGCPPLQSYLRRHTHAFLPDQEKHYSLNRAIKTIIKMHNPNLPRDP